MDISIARVPVCVMTVGIWASMAVAVNIETVPVGNIDNKGELSGEDAGGYGPDRICGAVDYLYRIGKYEVTAGQYTEFLNKVARTDTHGLYNTNMDTANYQYGCNIKRSGSPGSYTYGVASDWADRPVNHVSFWDACRFANWLHNDQPTGAQDAGTTETGAYTLNGYNGGDGRTIQRNADWKWAMTSEDEWYKAAYYNPAKSNYYDYPTSGDSVPSNTLDNPTEGGSSATYYDNFGTGNGGYTIGDPYYRTEGGDHENSGSPYGTFDQGGNVWEWNDSIVYQSDTYTYRGLRGGSFYGYDNDLLASARCSDFFPTGEESVLGFRVVAVPEPATMIMLALAAMGVQGRKRT